MWGKSNWNDWGSDNHYGKSLISDQAKELSNSLDKRIQDAMTNYQKVANEPVKIGLVAPAEWTWTKTFSQMQETKDKAKYDAVNAILEEKGYPDFQTILDYYLEEHPEYKL